MKRFARFVLSMLLAATCVQTMQNCYAQERAEQLPARQSGCLIAPCHLKVGSLFDAPITEALRNDSLVSLKLTSGWAFLNEMYDEQLAWLSTIIEKSLFLEEVSLGGCKGSGEIIAQVVQQGVAQGVRCGFGMGLTKIDLTSVSPHSDSIQALLRGCPHLRSLTLLDCSIDIGAIIRTLQEGYAFCLEELDLGKTKVTDRGVQELLTVHPKLKRLDLFACKGSAAGVAVAAQSGLRLELESLNLVETQATKDDVEAIVNGCPKLKKLRLHGSPDAIPGFIRGLRSGGGTWLEDVDVSCCNVTAADVRAIIEECPRLKTLGLMFAPSNVVDGIIDAFQQGYGQGVKTLVMCGCGLKATPQVLEPIENLRPEIQIRH